MEFVTPEEKAKLEARLAELKARRKVLSERIEKARELGDLRENADYHAAREEQGMDEAEIARLERKLASAQVVGQGAAASAAEAGVVFVGATVRLLDVQAGEEETIRLVGESSGDPFADPVEVTAASPMGEALLKARVGETVRVATPRGEQQFTVLEIL